MGAALDSFHSSISSIHVKRVSSVGETLDHLMFGASVFVDTIAPRGTRPGSGPRGRMYALMRGMRPNITRRHIAVPATFIPGHNDSGGLRGCCGREADDQQGGGDCKLPHF